jgi:hypothetical protein
LDSLIRLRGHYPKRLGDSMNYSYTCGGLDFESLELAVEFANIEYMRSGVILGIEKVIL